MQSACSLLAAAGAHLFIVGGDSESCQRSWCGRNAMETSVPFCSNFSVGTTAPTVQVSWWQLCRTVPDKTVFGIVIDMLLNTLVKGQIPLLTVLLHAMVEGLASRRPPARARDKHI